MTKAKDLARLGQISRLILDVKLASLHLAAQKRQHSLDLLAELNRPMPQDALSLVAGHQAELRYQRWAEMRRADINPILARQTAEMLVARDEAGQAFGRNQAVCALQGKHR